ncbi:MAG: class I SAM-dependent methyltransferase [Planctomycetes bacterium]|nr:class I SAM-dependent methyltransferase [Planctomycetota bacterium]
MLADHPLLSQNRFIAKPVQEIELSLFESLRENDVLFIDTTHVSKIGSDVNHLYFNVLPRLAPGVMIHIHDIFLPGEYPRDWIKNNRYFWNEQYLVHALLLFTSQFEILLANTFLRERHPGEFARAFPALPRQNGGSLWLRVRANGG